MMMHLAPQSQQNGMSFQQIMQIMQGQQHIMRRAFPQLERFRPPLPFCFGAIERSLAVCNGVSVRSAGCLKSFAKRCYIPL